MDSDLEAIARLEFGKAVERVSKETQDKMKTIMAMPRGGQLEAAKLRIRIEHVERVIHAYSDIWVELLEAKRGGRFTREDLNLVMEKVREIAAAQANNLKKSPERVQLASASQEIEMKITGITGSINRDLEIRVRRQAAFPRKITMNESSQISINIQHVANVNLGTQVGTINSVLHAMSDQGESNRELALAIKHLSEAIVNTPQLQDLQKQEALHVISELVRQAEAPPSTRTPGTLKLLVAGLPSLIGVAADVTTLWDQYAPMISTFFSLH